MIDETDSVCLVNTYMEHLNISLRTQLQRSFKYFTETFHKRTANGRVKKSGKHSLQHRCCFIRPENGRLKCKFVCTRSPLNLSKMAKNGRRKSKNSKISLINKVLPFYYIFFFASEWERPVARWKPPFKALHTRCNRPVFMHFNSASQTRKM